MSNLITRTYQITELDVVPAKNGLYSWYFLYQEPTSVESYHSIFKQKTFDTLTKGSLGELFKGKLKSQQSDYISEQTDVDHTLLQFATESFCPPIYIGISKNLNRRLNTHLHCLRTALHLGLTSKPNKVDFNSNDDNLDSDLESRYFGARIANVMKGAGQSRLSYLFVRTVEIDGVYDRKSLLNIEKILNHTFTPIYGKR